MLLAPNAVHALITIGFGALAGGLTNAVAIWMLFHPHEPRGIGPLRIQGAIPKNRARLAKTIGRTVGERLLTSDDVSRRFASPALRDAFHTAVMAFVRDLFETDRGSLRAELSPALIAEIEAILPRIGGVVAERAQRFAASPEFPAVAGRFLERLRTAIADRPVGDLLTVARRESMRERVDAWVADAVHSPHLEETVHGWLERQAVRAARDETPLLDRLPPGLVAAVERAIAAYLPVALERLAGVLRDPTARERLEETLHTLFRRFLDDLMFHERIVARLVVTERTISRVLDNLGRDGVDEMSRLLDEPEMRAHVARHVNDAVVTFLRRPLAAHVQHLGGERVDGVVESATRYIVALLRDDATRAYVIERLDRALASTERRTWGDVLSRVPTDRAATWIADGLQEPRVRTWVADGTTAVLDALLDRPIGRPSDRLGDDAAERIGRHLEPVLWEWLQRQIPPLVARLDVAGMVEEKVLGFSLTRMEEIVRLTTQRELDLIVRLGYVLGAIVGTAAWGVGLLFS